MVGRRCDCSAYVIFFKGNFVNLFGAFGLSLINLAFDFEAFGLTKKLNAHVTERCQTRLFV